MNNANIIGNLTRDPELRFIAGSGKAVANMSIAVSRPYQRDKTDFFNVVVWGKQAENCANHLSKGSKVALSGYFYNDEYEKDGQKRIITKFNAGQVEFLSWNKKEENNSDSFQAIEDSDDIPF